jgi:hypothetical protein
MNKLLDHTVIVIIPVYNISGALARNGTVKSKRSEMYGFQGNGQYLDLNRDFIKCDSKNALSITALFTKWDPDILIDNHVSNGADYSYVMTMLVGQPDKLGHGQQEFLRKTMLPDLYGRMEKRGFLCRLMSMYGEVRRTKDCLVYGYAEVFIWLWSFVSNLLFCT